MKQPTHLLMLAIFALGSCRAAPSPNQVQPAAEAAIAPILSSPDSVDTHSYAKPLEARVTHLALDLAVDFDTKRVGGQAILDIERKPYAKQIVLDDNGLEIDAVTDASNRPLQWHVGANDPKFGAPLAIELRPDTRRISIRYKSAADAGAFLWLTPAQTAGKKAPFLFNQGESIENRSWIPTQDSPGIRQSWEAWITVPAGLTAVMSALKGDKPDPTPTPPGRKSFYFNMDKPVAPYLIAIAVGDIAFKPLGPRTGVWAEPVTLQAAAAELADTEKMVAAAEKLYGPYRWGRYDMLVLPPSFPYGGEENPNMTFLTPTFIAGDKSLVSLVAHELSHSWSGNLATNATWEDFWLNEGMTTYAEGRVVEEIYGKKAGNEHWALSVDSLDKAVAENGGSTGPDTRLHLDLTGRHPDEGLTDVAYDKGGAFLRTIEAIVGRDRFDVWLKGWFDRHAFQPVTSALFLADIRANLVKGDKALENRLMLDQWVYHPGIPANMARPPADTFAEQDKASAAFASGSPAAAAWSNWDTEERLRFLNRLPRKLTTDRLAALDAAFGLDRATNMELRFAWLDLAVANRYDPALPSLEQFLTAQGRGKFVEPLITALAKDEQWGRPIASRLYARTRPLYHPLVTRDLDKLKLGQP